MRRQAEAGTTLIEILAALAIAAMIGIAGFTLLDGVTTRDAQLAGRLGRLAQVDRAFGLLLLDLTQARQAEFLPDGGLRVVAHDHVITWYTGAGGLRRRIAWPVGDALVQQVLNGPAQLATHASGMRAIVLTLPDTDIRRIFAMPESGGL